MNKELEEAAGKLYPLTGEVGIDHRNYLRKEGFINGAKYQAERTYSEEEVIQLNVEYNKYIQIFQPLKNGIPNFAMWFQKHKKK